MNFLQAVRSCFRQYARGVGRAPRSEYWYWYLFTILGSLVLTALDILVFHVNIHQKDAVYPLDTAFAIITFIPTWAVGLRRLHDVGRSGWWLLISLTIIGIIPLFYWSVKKGDAGPNRFDDVIVVPVTWGRVAISALKVFCGIWLLLGAILGCLLLFHPR